MYDSTNIDQMTITNTVTPGTDIAVANNSTFTLVFSDIHNNILNSDGITFAGFETPNGALSLGF